MSKKDIDYIRGYERDLIDKDQRKIQLQTAMWNMVFLNWDFAAQDKAKMPNVRTLIDTTPSDALRNASIALSNTIPRWDVSPYSASLREFERTEKLEHCLEFNFRKMNQRGIGTLLYDKMCSSLLYDEIITRIDDLEFQYKGVKKLSPLQKRIRSQGRFLGQVFDPRTIHVETGMGTFTALLHVENMRAIDVYNYWKLYEHNETKEGRQVAEALRKMDEQFGGNTQKQINGMRFIMYEFVNDVQILKHGHFYGTSDSNVSHVVESQTGSKTDIIFADEENTLGFINWSFRRGGNRMESQPEYQINPMLAPLHWGNSWETLNVIQSLVLSEPIKRMFEVHQFQQSIDGNRLPESDDGVVVGNRGDEVRNLPPAQLDPTALSIVEALKSSLSRTTGANILSDINAAKNTPFATLNAQIQIALSRLDINRRDGALSCADDAMIMLRWVEKTKVPLRSQRAKNSRVSTGGYGTDLKKGDAVFITADDFDTDECEIMVDIKPKTPTDYQQQIISAIQLHDKLRVPYAHLLETLGFENTELLNNQYEDELFNDAEVQAAVQNIAFQEQMKQQQAMQAQQQQGQQPPPPQEAMTGMPSAGGGISQSAMGALSGLGQGINPAMGGTSPSQFAPTANLRETVAGTAADGSPIQAGG